MLTGIGTKPTQSGEEILTIQTKIRNEKMSPQGDGSFVIATLYLSHCDLLPVFRCIIF